MPDVLAGEEFEVHEIPPEENPFLSNKSVPPSSTRRPSKSGDVELIIRSLEKFYFSIGVMIRIVNVQDSVTIVGQATELAESWRVLLESDTKVRRMMKNMIRGGGWGTVITAHLLVALPIAENHGINFSKILFNKSQQESEEEYE
jgi:hypothetical protein